MNKKLSLNLRIEDVCDYHKITRQGFYKKKKVLQQEEKIKNELLNKVLEIRKILPRCGVRKLKKMMENEGLSVSRDKLFQLLGEEDLLIKPKKSYQKTTHSGHHFRKHRNLIRTKKAENPEDIFVADITYIRTFEGFSYLALITDIHSRKIVGYDFCDSLSVEGAFRALKMATKSLKDPKKRVRK